MIAVPECDIFLFILKSHRSTVFQSVKKPKTAPYAEYL